MYNDCITYHLSVFWFVENLRYMHEGSVIFYFISKSKAMPPHSLFMSDRGIFMKRKNRVILSLLAAVSLAMVSAPAGVYASNAAASAVQDAGALSFVTTAKDAVKHMEAAGFVDTDGSKLQAVILSYDRAIPASSVGTDTYSIDDYGTTLRQEDLTQGKDPGQIKKVYVNDKPEMDAKGGTASGSYVIIEVNTDYQTGRFPRSYAITMYAGVTQKKAIRAEKGIILPSDEAITNYTKETYVGYDPQTGKPRAPEYYNYAKEGSYHIRGIEGYQLHTLENGTAFHAVHCFDEANGRYWDLDLPYALYVPKDYDPHKTYGLLLHIHDAGSMSADPRLTLTESQAASNYASEDFQNLARKNGLDGVIVVCPAIPEFYAMDEAHPHYELRMARDNWTLSCAEPAIWQLMDHLTRQYHIDPDRIYGSGQSMGGMTIMAMAAQRDNYFAALLPMSCKWGNNFNKGYPFNGTSYYNMPADGTIVWQKDSHGNPVNYNNWFYMVSDDNILYLNTAQENTEYRVLYQDLAGLTIPREELLLDSTTTARKRNASIRRLTARPNETGIYQAVLTGSVSHMSAWFYGHGTPACYEWLLKQTRKTEMARSKLPLNRPFALADQQKKDADHIYSVDREDPSCIVYYPTGRPGAGTEGYNSPVTALGSKASLPPGWTPSGKD